MRILLDEAHLGWDQAWDLTQRTLAYTNHTLLPEALEKWPLAWFEMLLPRHLEIIYEINRRLLDDVRTPFPGRRGPRRSASSLIEEGAEQARSAWPTSPSSARTAPTAWPRSTPSCCARRPCKDLAEMFPERFNNKTNGVTPRRWLLLANPALARVDHRRDRRRLDHRPRASSRSSSRWPTTRASASRFARPSARPRRSFADWLESTSGQTVDPDTIFDCQVKRIHEYKRQLLNALRIVVLYNRLRENPNLEMPPRTFFFAGKAAPAYHLAKLIIKFINNLAGTIDADPAVRGRLKVVFLPDYCVSLAERLIPASDVSNQISTAGYEASGTSNMKFMMNGALTIGTRDGATIEMAEEAGEENFFLFGLTAEQVAGSRGWYSPRWHYDNEPETRAALDLIFSDHFSRNEPGIFAPLRDTLLTQRRSLHAPGGPDVVPGGGSSSSRELYADPDAWARKAILNVAGSGKFSSDRTHRRIRGRHLECRALSGETSGKGRSAMQVSPLAGKPADASILINVPRLVTAYYTGRPDPSVPGQRVVFGTSGHRGSSLDNAFNEAHILAITQAICLYRKQQGIDGPLFIGC